MESDCSAKNIKESTLHRRLGEESLSFILFQIHVEIEIWKKKKNNNRRVTLINCERRMHAIATGYE